MSIQIITMYCFFDELLKAIGHKDDPQTVLSTAEVMTVALSREREILLDRPQPQKYEGAIRPGYSLRLRQGS